MKSIDEAELFWGLNPISEVRGGKYVVIHALNKHFDALFGQLNPGTSFEQRAASEHQSIIRLIEDTSGLAAKFSPTCFLQGSYRRKTAIYTINDVDIVALCPLSPVSLTLWTKEQRWRRDELFDTIAAPLRADPRYRDKVRYSASSMCIKVDLGIKVEILPAVYGSLFTPNTASEPFHLYRPAAGRWEKGYARYHQQHLTEKNADARTGGNFIPAIKVLKHLRSLHGLEIASFHLECLLYALPDKVFRGNPATYISSLLHAIAGKSAEDWYQWTSTRTPCQERRLFSDAEWKWDSWKAFHDLVISLDSLAQAACRAPDAAMAVRIWQVLLGEEFFPRQVAA